MENQAERQNKLGTEKISSLLTTFSVPAIIGMLVNTLYNVVDRIFIGHIPGIGGLAITGVGVTLPIMTMILAFGLLIGVGTSARVSISLGKGDSKTAEKLLGNAVTLIIIIGILITILGLIFTEPVLRAFGASSDTMIYAKQYIQIIFVGTIFSLIGMGLNHSIRCDGNPKIAMYTLLLGAGVNVILNPLFIFGLGMGVRGAALATVISQIISATWIISYFRGKKSTLKMRRSELKLDKRIVMSIFTIGMSPFAIQIAQSFVQVVANNSLQTYGGDIAIGAMTIITTVSLMATMPIVGINQGSQPIIGYNFGAKKFGRVKQTIKYTVTAATIIATIGFIFIQVLPNQIITAFNNDIRLREMAREGMRIYLMMLPLIGMQIVASSYFQAIGRAKVSMVLSLLRQVIILIPLILIFPKFLGLRGIWIAGATADLISTVITGVIFMKSVKKLGEKEKTEGVI